MVLNISPSASSRASEASILFLAVALVIPTVAVAQLGQYQPPGARTLIKEPPGDRIKRATKNAPWRWGPLRLEPRLSLSNVGYDNNVFASAEGEEKVSDLHARVGAGITAYSRLGSKIYSSTYVTPEYAWWKDQDDLRKLTVSYGAGAFAFFNRMQFGIQGVSVDRQQKLSSEEEIPVQRLDESIAVDARVEIRQRLALVGKAASSRSRFDDLATEESADLFVKELDSDSERTEALVAMTLRNSLEIGVGFENRRTDFRFDPDGRSNEGSGPVVSVSVTGDRTRLEAHAVAQKTTFTNPDLGVFEETTGSLLVDRRFREKTRVSLHVGRRLEYGVSNSASTIDEERRGISIWRQLGRRLEGRLFAESGSLEFRDSEGPNVGRIDDLSAAGAEVRMDLGRMTAMRVYFAETNFDSNLPEFTRRTRGFGLGVEFKQGLLPW